MKQKCYTCRNKIISNLLNEINVVLVIDNCVSLPCQNRGTCFNGLNKFTCQCATGYTGTYCDGGT